MITVYGHKQIKDRLLSCVREDRVNHAYLFCGPCGIGKTTTARWFAAALMCENDQNRPCGACRMCRLANAGSHPDIIVVDDNFNGNEKIKSGSVDQSRMFKRDVFKKPMLARRKVYIVPRADEMTDQAQNSLLKVIEEPPSYCVIILVCQNDKKLLDTILSRVTPRRFSPLKDSEMREYLAKYPPDKIDVLCEMSGGAPMRADEIMNDDEFTVIKTEAERLFTEYIVNRENIIDLCRFLTGQKARISVVLDILNAVLHRAAVSQSGPVADALDKGGICDMFDKIEKAKAMLDRNVNFTAVITNMLI